jgi:hypothetical protein
LVSIQLHTGKRSRRVILTTSRSESRRWNDVVPTPAVLIVRGCGFRFLAVESFREHRFKLTANEPRLTELQTTICQRSVVPAISAVSTVSALAAVSAATAAATVSVGFHCGRTTDDVIPEVAGIDAVEEARAGRPSRRSVSVRTWTANEAREAIGLVEGSDREGNVGQFGVDCRRDVAEPDDDTNHGNGEYQTKFTQK